jgi:hypothetical protein
MLLLEQNAYFYITKLIVGTPKVVATPRQEQSLLSIRTRYQVICTVSLAQYDITPVPEIQVKQATSLPNTKHTKRSSGHTTQKINNRGTHAPIHLSPKQFLRREQFPVQALTYLPEYPEILPTPPSI